MSDREAIAHRLVLQQAVMGRLKAAVDADRSDAAAIMRPGDAQAVYGPSGDHLGRVRMDKGRQVWRVTDRAKLIAWLVANHPHEVVTELTVRAATERALLKDGGITDPNTGEIVTPPGIEATDSPPRLVVASTGYADIAAAELLGGAHLEITPREDSTND